MVGNMDRDRNHKVSFIEWCCAYYSKSYDELFTFVDEEARQRALEAAKRLEAEAQKAEQEIERAKQQKELQAQLRAAALERESKLVRIFPSFRSEYLTTLVVYRLVLLVCVPFSIDKWRAHKM